MEKIVLFVVGIFFIIGIIDCARDRKNSILKEKFKDGLKSIGDLALSMVGIIVITPVLSDILNKSLVPILENFKIEPTVIVSSFIAIDMGAYNISKEILNDPNMVIFSGILIASTIGCTISFTLPLALGMIKGEGLKELSLGILCGFIAAPIGIIIGGLILKIDLKIIIINTLPLIILAILLGVGISKYKNLTIKIFVILGRAITVFSILIFGISGFQSIVGIEIVKGLMKIDDALVIVCKIGIFLAGAYVMIEYLKKYFQNKISKISELLGINNEASIALIGSLASAIVIFTSFDSLDSRGKIICSAFSVSGAYVLGGQLGFVASMEKEAIIVYIGVKLLSGILGVIFAIIYMKKLKNSSLSLQGVN